VGFRYLLATRSYGGSVTLDESQAVASWGLGIGLEFLLMPSETGTGTGFTLGLRYLWGSEATYQLVDDSVFPAEFVSNRPTTNILVPHVGISFHY